MSAPPSVGGNQVSASRGSEACPAGQSSAQTAGDVTMEDCDVSSGTQDFPFQIFSALHREQRKDDASLDCTTQGTME